MNKLVFGVSDFVAVFNQTLETAYPNVVIAGELANFRVSKNRWVYFDLKDEFASVKFFGTVYNLPGPLEDGLTLEVHGIPRLHPQYGFSVTIQTIQPTGEGSIMRAQALLEAKLQTEGLFDVARKRILPYPPAHIGLITSVESAAYADFMKILNERWSGIKVELANVQVQGEVAPKQIVKAIEWFNEQAELPEVLVITRGGGNAEDLAAFSTEQVTRAVAASRIPTLVAIGHEVDWSLAEMAADQRASTPSNAAQFLVPDKGDESNRLQTSRQHLGRTLSGLVSQQLLTLQHSTSQLQNEMSNLLKQSVRELRGKQGLLLALSPNEILKRGYVIVRKQSSVVKSIKQLKLENYIHLQFNDGSADASVTSIQQSK